MRILVLGGGAQGRVIAADLARSLPGEIVRVADRRRPELEPLANLGWIEADLGSAESIARALEGFDLAVGALPSRLGAAAQRAAIESRTPLVDVSFSPEDPLSLEAEARQAGIVVVPDCGLAPGLSHLVVGRAAEDAGVPQEIAIYVGGVAADPGRPFGYVVTWSIEDLLEEYTRPARIVHDGEVVAVPVFSGLERIEVGGVGEMEAFYSDGLRTLLYTLGGVRHMEEKTLRWPGHAAAVRPLLASGRFLEEIRRSCTEESPRDLVVLVVRIRWPGRRREIVLVDRADAATALTAMARTTALTASVVAQLAARGGLPAAGVQPLERVARDPAAYDFVVAELSRRGIRLRTTAG